VVQADSRLDLLAGNNLTNTAGGIIAGRDVSLTAVDGDVSNERSITTHQSALGSATERTDLVDNAARVEAAGSLTINAGRDVNNTGGVLSSGTGTSITAGRDVNIVAAQAVDASTRTSKFTRSTTTQNSASVTAGGDLSITAGRDLAVTASQLAAGGNVALSATDNVSVSSAADEAHSYTASSHKKWQNDDVTQVASTITAGGSVAVAAGQDLTLTSSNVTAGADAYLYAGDKLQMLAAQDSSYSLYDMKKKGSFGSKKTQHDEVTQVTNRGSEVTSGGNTVLASGGDQLYQAAKLDSGNDLTLASGGAITFQGVKDLDQETHTKSSSNLAWTSAKGKGNTDETLQQTEMVARGKTVITAVNGLKIDVKQIDKQTVSQVIDTMVAADPKLAWLKDAEARGDVNWQQVKEVHDSFKYSNSSLGEGAMLAIIIAVTVLTAGAASTMAASMGSAAGFGAGTTMAAATAGTAATAATATTAAVAATAGTVAGLGNVMASAALTSIFSSGAVSVINNKGNIGAAVKDTFSSSGLKNAMVAAMSAGAINYADATWFDSASAGAKVVTAGPIQNPGYTNGMLSSGGMAQTILQSGTHAIINSGISTAINGGSFGSNFANAAAGEAIDFGAAAGNKSIGDLAHGMGVSTALATKLVLHAALGGLISKARGGDFATGAIAGGVAEGIAPLANELLANFVSSRFDTSDRSTEGVQARVATAQIIGLIAADMAGGDPATGSLIGGAGQKYNDDNHWQDPTVLFQDNGEPLENTGPSKLDQLKAEISLTILGGLVPELGALRGLGGLFGSSSEGLVAENAGMFSKISEEAGASSGGAVDVEVGSAEYGSDAVGEKEVAGTATTGGTKAAATEGTFPDEVFTGKKPHQTTPGIGSVTQERYNPATGKLEESVIEYDQYGRQVKRTDYTNHGYGNQEKPSEYHSDPHTHTYEYGPGYGSNGKETRINND
jgi:filamentous hemagglutinin